MLLALCLSLRWCSMSAVVVQDRVQAAWTSSGLQSAREVCLCGSLGTAESDFGPQLRDLSAQHTVVAHDPRGYGKSQSRAPGLPRGAKR